MRRWWCIAMGMPELGGFMLRQGKALADTTGFWYQNSVGSAKKAVRIVQGLEGRPRMQTKLREKLAVFVESDKR